MRITKTQLRQIIKEELDKEFKQEIILEKGILGKISDLFKGDGIGASKKVSPKALDKMENVIAVEYDMLRQLILTNPKLSEEQKRELLNQLGAK